MRGLRTAARHPEVLEDQLTAIARAAAAETGRRLGHGADGLDRRRDASDFVARCARHGLGVAGVMVEVPSAALLAGPILAHATFASIGTNDLTQYTMAADRLLGAVAHLSDAVAAGRPAASSPRRAPAAPQQGRPVGVCGEAAADPALAVVLVGLGVTSLSMTPRALRRRRRRAGATTSTSADGSRSWPWRAPPTPAADARAAVLARWAVTAAGGGATRPRGSSERRV